MGVYLLRFLGVKEELPAQLGSFRLSWKFVDGRDSTFANARCSPEALLVRSIMNREGFRRKTVPILGTAFTLVAGILSLAASSFAQTENVLYSFTGGTDGGFPLAGLLFDRAGHLYGTSSQGGDLSGCALRGCGVVYRLSPNSTNGWTETVLYTFTNGADGGAPVAGLIADHAGNLYGTASVGGNLGCIPPDGCGVVFKLSHTASGWKQTVLYTFDGSPHGSGPSAPLVFDSAGNLYGTTLSGGNNKQCFLNGCGVVFELSHTSRGWKETVLHSFTCCSAGGMPHAGLIRDATGNLYGTASEFGNMTACNSGCGVVFKLSRLAGGGWKETVLQAFDQSDGGAPYASLIFDSAGSLYGTTAGGGNLSDCFSAGCGVVFQIVP